MSIKNNLAVFILTYGRPEKIHTLNTLRKQNYTGDIFLVCSEDDKTLNKYQEIKDVQKLVFNKNDYSNKFDIGDNFKDNRVVVFARNAIYDLAKKTKYKYIIVLDDDYTSFRYTSDANGVYLTKQKIIKNLDLMFLNLLSYYKLIEKNIGIKTLCIAQGGDFIGGEMSRVFQKKVTRKAMNFFMFNVNNPLEFLGRINEDVNSYVKKGNIGELLLTIADIRLEQLDTQSNTGGLTEFYLDSGTYVKSFYTVLFSPSCTNITLMGNKNKRLHHQIKWNNAVPKILNQKYKK